jgi:HAD superfamily hydrolase (TIGR01490 family)
VAIAFIDVDKTLLPYNSASRWVRAELRQGFLGLGQALRAAVWIGRYHLGFADVDAAIRESIASLRGSREADLRQRTLAFYEAQIRGNYRPGALTALAEHARAGEARFLLTSSSTYLSAAIVAELGLEGYCATAFAVDAAGRFTGNAVEPLCFGAGKVTYARTVADARGVSLADCTYYADSTADLAMLEAVGHPVAINPDPRLARVARARGWPVLDWGQPKR